MSSILQKLQFKAQSPVLVLNAPPEFKAALAEWKKLSQVHETIDKKCRYAFAVIFVTSPAEVKKLGVAAIATLEEDAPLWFGYPKKSSKKYDSSVSRDEGWGPLEEKGFETVRLIALDDDWSILRFRKSIYVKK